MSSKLALDDGQPGRFCCDPLKAPVISASFYLIDSSKTFLR